MDDLVEPADWYEHLAAWASEEAVRRRAHEATVWSRDRQIVAAHRAGMSYRYIGSATGLSHTRVANIVKKAGKA